MKGEERKEEKRRGEERRGDDRRKEERREEKRREEKFLLNQIWFVTVVPKYLNCDTVFSVSMSRFCPVF
jgi:hypothetical protein